MQEESGSIKVKSIYKFAQFTIPGPSSFLLAVYRTVHLRQCGVRLAEVAFAQGLERTATGCAGTGYDRRRARAHLHH